MWKTKAQVGRKCEGARTSCCEGLFLVAKLDIDKDAGENGKEEH